MFSAAGIYDEYQFHPSGFHFSIVSKNCKRLSTLDYKLGFVFYAFAEL